MCVVEEEKERIIYIDLCDSCNELSACSARSGRRDEEGGEDILRCVR